ncbi:hypothetical protein M8R20_46165 [Pseudomonas sp. R2.Fl]|nr:hypothetical protein [Pseudomonas sp. R2.Fl]MCL6714377.1 hypothetical protein [Pseudomonas sp. R2.Fl]
MNELKMHMAARVMLWKGESDDAEVNQIVVLDVCDVEDEEIELGFDIPRTPIERLSVAVQILPPQPVRQLSPSCWAGCGTF